MKIVYEIRKTNGSNEEKAKKKYIYWRKGKKKGKIKLTSLKSKRFETYLCIQIIHLSSFLSKVARLLYNPSPDYHYRLR